MVIEQMVLPVNGQVPCGIGRIRKKGWSENSEADGVGFGLISGLLTDPHVTINAGETIPANTEIGFMVESGSVLAIELFNNTVLTTYDENDNEVESKRLSLY